MSEKTNELYMLTQKAQKMELINEELALKLYLEIFENHTPKISKTYESAIRLLEKRGRCKEALDICNQAIELINAQEVSGIASRFESIRDRLERKLSDQVPEEAVEEKKPFKVKPGHIIGLILFLLVLFLLFKYTSPERELDVNLEGKDSLEGGLSGVFEPTDNTQTVEYPVTDTMIQIATDELLKNIDVKSGGIIPQNDTLGIAVIVAPGTGEERSKEVAEIYLRALAGAASATYADLKPPSDSSLGDLYSHYELVITVGVGPKEEDFTAKGSKLKTSKELYWRKLD